MTHGWGGEEGFKIYDRDLDGRRYSDQIDPLPLTVSGKIKTERKKGDKEKKK